MAVVSRVRFDLVSPTEKKLGRLEIATLPSMKEVMGLAALVRDDESGDLESVQLVEGCEYLFEIHGGSHVTVDKDDLFIADDASGTRGRLRTKLSTGRVGVTVTFDGVACRPVAFEVRSTKLGYLEDYRWMLEDIAEVGAELLLERFAPSEQRFRVDDKIDAATLYQRFVFLRGLLEGERLSAALRRITAEPYVQWERVTEMQSPSRGLRASGRLSHQVVAAGHRIPWPEAPNAALATLPQRIRTERTEETLDNVPNRFVAFALSHWRDLVGAMLSVLDDEAKRSTDPSAPLVRGLKEGAALAEHLDDLLRAPVFRDVGTLAQFPGGNQVLLKKEGYREVLHSYLLVELGAALAWEGGDDVFRGGQRNVATLYEYWVFLELAKIVSGFCDEPLDLRSLVSESSTGLSMVLSRKKAHTVGGTLRRHGRRFRIELSFNQQFAPGPSGTWTRSLRPDCSLHVMPSEPERKEDDVWLHFDAKYRASKIDDIVGAGDDEPALVAKAEDLYKMHTYRDAIVRAVGAYVVFPGNATVTREQYGEVLPGLGAFPLRPARGGPTAGSIEIRKFLHDAFEHLSTQTSKHERERHWRRRSRTEPGLASPLDAVDFLSGPPADTAVLLGYAKSAAHREWIEKTSLYNLRADPKRHGAVGLNGRELAAEFLVLYGAGEETSLFQILEAPRAITATELIALGYPEPRGQLYLCLHVRPVDHPPWWQKVRVSALRSPPAEGRPKVITWRDIAASAQ